MSTITEESAPVLWCVNIHGPDDVVAMPSYIEAVAGANRFNEWWGRYRTQKPLHEQYDARMWAVPIEWPHDAASHAANLLRTDDYQDIRRAALSQEPVAWANGAQIRAVKTNERDGPVFLAATKSDREDIALYTSPSGEGQTWRSIETAPKDGAVVLLAHNQAAFTGWWQEDNTSKGLPGWCDGATNNYDEYFTYEPTHWMPLPSLPKEGGNENG